MERITRSFGEAVRRHRELLGLSQEELATRSRSHRNYIGGVERGERNPTLTKIVAIAAGLELSPAQLMNALLDRRGGK